MSDTLITCENVGKKFCRDLKKSLWYGVKDSCADIFGRRQTSDAGMLSSQHTEDSDELRPGEFWANKDIHFEVKRGECLGLIGRNGAGKTTLLKMLSGLIKPDIGQIRMRGRVGALIALGAGFNPILSGRENIHVNGSILGLSQSQVRDRLERIVEFAEISDAIDSPVRTYSSGMQVRLGFSSAVNLIEPDILLLDEVLAVGDIGFTIKCLNLAQELTSRTAVVFVSHNMQFVSRFCSRALVLTGGTCVADTTVADAVSLYHKMFKIGVSQSGTGGASIKSATLSVNGISATKTDPLLTTSDMLSLDIEIHVDAEVSEEVIFRISVLDRLKILITDDLLGESPTRKYRLTRGPNAIHVQLPRLNLNTGRYAFVVTVECESRRQIMIRNDGIAPFTIDHDTLTWGSHIHYQPVQISQIKNGSA